MRVPLCIACRFCTLVEGKYICLHPQFRVNDHQWYVNGESSTLCEEARGGGSLCSPVGRLFQPKQVEDVN